MADLAEDTLPEEQLNDDPDAPKGDEGAGDDAAAAGGEEGDTEYFLEADERHRYKTREDAIKAISESGRRISELSTWESKVGQAYGGLTADDVASLLDELIELRQKAKAAPPAADRSDARDTAGNRDAAPRDPKVVAQEEANLRWLKEKGYLTKSEVDAELKALRDEVASLKSGSESADQERFNHRVEEGETYVKSLVKEAKLPDAISEKAIRYITGCLSEANDPDGKLFGQFLRGGDAMRTVLKSLFDEFSGAITLAKANASSTYQQGKEKSANAGKPLPKGSGGSGAAPADKNAAKNLVQSAKPDIHDKAWAAFQESLD